LVCFYIACQEIHILQKQVWLTGWSTPYWQFVNEVESEGKHKIDRKLSLHIYREGIIVYSNELSVHLNELYLRLFSDILCDSHSIHAFKK
jgi:hypothetical protein